MIQDTIVNQHQDMIFIIIGTFCNQTQILQSYYYNFLILKREMV